MSRICVKNLPKYVGEDRLREFFSQKGEVTDAKLMRTKDGKSRQFGFVGYRTEEEAQEAYKFFNKSFLDTCRITCEIARKVGDQDLPRPWSKYSLRKQEQVTDEGKKVTGKNSSEVSGSRGDKIKSKTDNEINDPLLQEFLEVMKPRSKSKLWANDTVTAPSVKESNVVTNKKNKVAKGVEKSKVVDDNLMDTDEKGDGSSAFDEGDKPHNVVLNEVVSDMDYFNSRVKREWSDSNSDEDDDSDNSSDNSSDSSRDEDDADANGDLQRENSMVNSVVNALEGDVSGAKIEEGSPGKSEDELAEAGDPTSSMKNDKDEVLVTGRLFVRNLPYTTTEEELEDHFRKFGNVAEVHRVVDKDTKRSKGIAYIRYSMPESAMRALEELDNSIFQGRLLHVMPAKQKNPSGKQEMNTSDKQSSNTFKQQKEEERKASEASGNTRAWNTLFMRPDTVVENIARKFGISKSDFLDKEADDLPVRIALGETQVIAETKKALAKAGVNVASLEEFASGKSDGTKRSNHVIIVKNLPYGSSESDLANLFGKFGSLDKVIVPPTKTLALVIFLEPSEARAAFRGLAYKRYKDAPLYLEWAPANVIAPDSSIDDSNNKYVVGKDEVKRVLLEQQMELTDTDIDPDRVESRSIYVKNLNFRTSDDSLKKHFSEHIKGGKILSVRVKKHLKNGKNVSMGFGFIELDSADTAVNVCRDLQGTVLDGHALILQLCHAKEGQLVKKVENDKSSTKLIVRNVAFEATEKDLRQLFSPFGQIKRLRLPLRFGNHRGFAFVEYVTKQEAQNALQALANTHLYGRHLVLERAKEGESLEELRARTAAQFNDAQNGLLKISQKRKHLAAFDEDQV